MVLSGYGLLYGIECNVAMATKMLKKLMKDVGIVR